MRIAYFSPLNPCKTGISDYSEELLPALAKLVDVDLFVDGYVPSNPAIRERFAIYDCAEFSARNDEQPYDVNLYQMGNSLHHAAVYGMLMRHPGIVVLHDAVLHHFFLELARHDKNPSVYLREMAYTGGTAGIEIGLGVMRGEVDPPLFEYPLIDRVVQTSLGIIVHSKYACQQVISRAPCDVGVIPAHIVAPPLLSVADRLAARAELGLASDAIVFGAFGYATPTKRLDVALRAFSRLHSLLSEARLLIVGRVDPPDWLDPVLAELDLRDAVTLTGSIPFDRFERSIFATDVCLNLRYPTAGETSASLLRIMAAGIPAIVSDVGSFAEFPDDCCRKVRVDSTEEHELFLTLRALAMDERLRHQIGETARAYVLRQHTPSDTARGYVDLLEKVLASAPGNAQSAGTIDVAEYGDLPDRGSRPPLGSAVNRLLKNVLSEAITDLTSL